MNIDSFRVALSRMGFPVWLVVMTVLLVSPVALEADEIRGRVIQVRDSTVIIELEHKAPVRNGDRVELSFSAAGDVIVVGSWKVSAVRSDGLVEAILIEAQTAPTVNFDARIYPADKGSANAIASDGGEAHPAPQQEKPAFNLPEILGRRDATRDFSELAESTVCDNGKIIRGDDRLEMHSASKKNIFSKRCSVRISKGALENLHVSVRMTVDSKDFLVSLFFGNLVEKGGKNATVFMLEGATEGSIMINLGLMTSQVSSGSFGKRKKNIFSTWWISVDDAGGNELASKRFHPPAGFFNPTPGTMEFVKSGKHGFLLWNGEEVASWEMEPSISGEVRLAFVQVGKRKGKTTFEQISVQRLDIAQPP